jgi:hypothetical protein
VKRARLGGETSAETAAYPSCPVSARALMTSSRATASVGSSSAASSTGRARGSPRVECVAARSEPDVAAADVEQQIVRCVALWVPWVSRGAHE